MTITVSALSAAIELLPDVEEWYDQQGDSRYTVTVPESEHALLTMTRIRFRPKRVIAWKGENKTEWELCLQ